VNDSTFDVAVIGAGVVGAAIAHELSSYGVDVVVLEREAGPAWGASGSNAGIIHTGFEVTAGSFEADMMLANARRWQTLFDELQMDPQRFVVEVVDNPQRVVLGRQMLVVDGDEHTRHRAPFADPFKHSAVRRLFTDAVVQRVERLLDAIACGRSDRHGEAASGDRRDRRDGAGTAGGGELGAAFAYPFAVGVASDVLGLGLDEVEEVHRYTREYEAAQTRLEVAARAGFADMANLVP